jgi:hypothetical protein
MTTTTTRAQLLDAAARGDAAFLRAAARYPGGLAAAQEEMRSADVIRGGGTCQLIEGSSGAANSKLERELRIRAQVMDGLARSESDRLAEELRVRRETLARIAAKDRQRSAPTPVRSRSKPVYRRPAPVMRAKTGPTWLLPGPVRTLDPADPDVVRTARHEAGHAAGAFLKGWEVTEVRLNTEGGGDCEVRRPKYLDRRLGYQQFAVICLAAKAHVGWTRHQGDRKDKWDAHKALSNLGDPNRVRVLKDAARAEAEQLAASPKFRAIARRIEEALLLKGALSMRAVEPLLHEARREYPS